MRNRLVSIEVIKLKLKIVCNKAEATNILNEYFESILTQLKLKTNPTMEIEVSISG